MEKTVKKAIVYNMKREGGEGGNKSKNTFFTKIDVQFLPSDAIIQHLGLRFRLAFYPTLYKFIVGASWA